MRTAFATTTLLPTIASWATWEHDMKRQLDPTSVWPPLSVERLIVTYSRMIVPSPTLTPVGVAGSNRNTCGAPPTTAYGGTATRPPRIAPALTIAPAGMTQPAPSLAPSSTMAVGWMTFFIAVIVKVVPGLCENVLAPRGRALLLGRRGLGRPGPPGGLHPVREQVELGIPQEVVVLEQPDHLERVALPVVPVRVDLLDQVEEHRPERDDPVHAPLLEQLDALRAERLGRGKRGKHENLGDVAADAVGLRREEPRGLLEDVLLKIGR